MNKLKRVFLCLVSLVCIALCCGCSKISLSTTLKSTGEIVDTIQIDLDNVDKSKRSIIYGVVVEYRLQLEESYEDNLIKYFGQKYNSEAFNSSERPEKISYILSKKPLFQVGDLEDYSAKELDDYKTLLFKKNFASIYAYLMYTNPNAFTYDAENDKVTIKDDYKSMIDIPISGNCETENNLFWDKYLQTCNPFYYNEEEPKFLYTNLSKGIFAGQTLKEVISLKTGISSEEVDYVFSFTTPYKRVHSDGTTTFSNQGYTHTWTLASVDDTISLWRNYANYFPWYVIAGSICVLGVVIALIVVFITKKIKSKKGLELLKEIDKFQNTK